VPDARWVHAAVLTERTLTEGVAAAAQQFGVPQCTATLQALAAQHVAAPLTAAPAVVTSAVTSVNTSAPRVRNHHAAAALYDLLHDALKCDACFYAAAAAVQARAAVLQAVYARPSNAVAWLNEHAGDALAGAAGAPWADVFDSSEYVAALQARVAAAAAAGVNLVSERK
jgi:hypothetical protein